MRLRELEEAGVLRRLPLKHNTRAYALTERGEALRPAIETLGRWGAAEPAPAGAPDHAISPRSPDVARRDG